MMDPTKMAKDLMVKKGKMPEPDAEPDTSDAEMPEDDGSGQDKLDAAHDLIVALDSKNEAEVAAAMEAMVRMCDKEPQEGPAEPEEEE